MNKHFNPAISEEKFAAWLDGMLTPVEMDEVSSFIENNSDMQTILTIEDMIDDDLLCNSSDYLQHDVFANLLSPTDFELPELNLHTGNPETLYTQNNRTPDFLPDIGFDMQLVSDTPDLDNSPIKDLEQYVSDINL